MYQVYVDKRIFADPRTSDLRLNNPVVELEVNSAGSFKFTVPKTHPYLDRCTVRNKLVEVFMDDEEEPLFEGVITSIDKDFWGNANCTCEGALSFLNDSILRPVKYQGKTARQLVEAYIASHNESVGTGRVDKQFDVGVIEVDGGSNMLRYTNWNTTMQELQEDILDDLGGYIRLRHSDGRRILDIIADAPNTSSQTIRLGENLLDYRSNIDSKELCTVLIPLGAKKENSSVEGLEEYLTIKQSDSDSDYLIAQIPSLVYGRIEAVHHWDDVTTVSALISKGTDYLQNVQFDDIYIEANVLDLHYADDSTERLKLMDMVRVVSPLHNLDREFMLTKMTINLDNPSANKFTLGKDISSAMTTTITRPSGGGIATGKG